MRSFPKENRSKLTWDRGRITAGRITRVIGHVTRTHHVTGGTYHARPYYVRGVLRDTNPWPVTYHAVGGRLVPIRRKGRTCREITGPGIPFRHLDGNGAWSGSLDKLAANFQVFTIAQFSEHAHLNTCR